MLWTRLILATAKSWNLKPESGTWKQEESIGFLSNLKMCFYLLVELDVFVLFCTSSGNGNVFHQKLAFSWRGTKKTKKTKDFGLFRPRLRQDSKIFGFFGFLVPPQEMATFSTKSLHFPGGVPKKPKKTKDFGLFRPRLRQDSKIFGFFGFFGTSSGNGNVFHQKLAFSWRGTKKTKKTKDFGLFRPRLRQDSKIFGFFGFLVPPQEMATFSTKSLHFPGGVPKKQKKQRFWTLQASPLPRL